MTPFLGKKFTVYVPYTGVTFIMIRHVIKRAQKLAHVKKAHQIGSLVVFSLHGHDTILYIEAFELICSFLAIEENNNKFHICGLSTNIVLTSFLFTGFPCARAILLLAY
ncbi:hypothetical protein ACJX0J_026181 [Zea mays]